MRTSGIALAPRAFVRSTRTREQGAVPMLDEARTSVALIAEDDEDLLEMMCYGLREWGFRVIPVRDGQIALNAFRDKRPDIALLDVGLPHLSGTEICRAIRDLGPTPVILVTGRGDEDSVVRGFIAGADDYVVKPFSYRQLELRIRAVLRRADARRPRGREIRAGTLILDEELREARVTGRAPIRLTRTEFRVLQLLAANLGRPVPTSRLVEHAWGFDEGDGQLLKSHVYHIRRKLGLGRRGPGALEAIPQLGYVLRIAADPGTVGSGTRKESPSSEESARNGENPSDDHE
jgi:DNA-binding response OmpR family regulator